MTSNAPKPDNLNCQLDALQQTKRGSIETGGPQYYFHDLSDAVKTYLRAKGAVRVALVTPYGATKTDYFAVSTDRKLDSQLKPVPGNVGHDRIQQGRAAQSIGEAELYKLLARDEIAPRRAAVMAYTCNLLLRTLPAIDRELHSPDHEDPIVLDISSYVAQRALAQRMQDAAQRAQDAQHSPCATPVGLGAPLDIHPGAPEDARRMKPHTEISR
ncbi:MAG TPA: hypothetical protein VEI73_11055 [Candidatus Acidoferrum sp.]|nr:hypothetical protein [Candidatus Acidoferrum sp.]